MELLAGRERVIRQLYAADLMGKTTVLRGGGVEIDGLSQSVRALQKIDRKYRQEAVQVFRDAATDVQKVAQRAIGSVGRYPTNRGMIGRSATNTGAGVKLRARKYPWAQGAEYGEATMHVFGVPYYQSHLKRRTMGRFRPPTTTNLMKNTGGYMIQPAIRQRLPKWEKEAGKRLQEITTRAMRQAGVRTYGR